MKKLLTLLPVIALMALPLLASAQTGVTFVSGSDIGAVITISNKIATWFMTIVVSISVVFFVMAGFLYVTSGGKEDNLKNAKNYLLYGIIGIGVAMLAKAIQLVVIKLISESG